MINLCLAMLVSWKDRTPTSDLAPEVEETYPPGTQLVQFFHLLCQYNMDINRLANLRQAYEVLERRVQRALNTQVGDVERLAEAQEEVLSYIQAVEQVSKM